MRYCNYNPTHVATHPATPTIRETQTAQNKTKDPPHQHDDVDRNVGAYVLFCSVCMYVRRYVWFECWGSKLERPSAPLPAPQSESCAYLMRVSVKRATARERERESALEQSTHTYNAMLEKLPLVYSCLKQLMHIKVSSDSAASSDVDSRQRKSALFAKLARQRAPACLK